ncbi:MAG TPA: signal peptidase I [Gemmatimonadaceae bacterium]|nr:signal peptidase I [Gemmatimonadaceae bacterium]
MPDPAPAKKKDAPPARRAAGGKPAEYLRLVVEVVLIFLVIRTLFIAGYRIPSGSMDPTLQEGDWLFVTPLPYGPHIPFTNWNLPGFMDPPRGRISIYQSPPQHWTPQTPMFMRDDSTPVIVKRIVAVPGDTIYMRKGVFYVNGVEQTLAVVPPPGADSPNETTPAFDWQHKFELAGSRFGPPPAVITHDDWGPLLVPKDGYFSLGDNRYNSIDARYYGFIPRKNFRGRPMIIYFSFDFDDLRVRWSRLLKILWNA